MRFLALQGDVKIGNTVPFKGVQSREFSCAQASFVLKTLLSTFTRLQNAPAELRRS